MPDIEWLSTVTTSPRKLKREAVKRRKAYQELSIAKSGVQDYLGGRCLVARGLNKDRNTVIGLATERYEEGKGFSFDLYYLNIAKWTDELQKQIEYAQKEFGYFFCPKTTKYHEDEYLSL